MRIPTWIVPPLIACGFLAVIAAGQTWELPTMKHEFSTASVSGQEQEVQMIVEGLRCRGTSNFFVAQLQQLPGVLGTNTFVQEHRAVIAFDPNVVTVEQIRAKIEAPVRFDDGEVLTPFSVKEILK